MTIRLVGIIVLFCSTSLAQNRLQQTPVKPLPPSAEKQSTDNSNDESVEPAHVVLPPAPLIARKHAGSVVVPNAAAVGAEGYRPKFAERNAVARAAAKAGQPGTAGQNDDAVRGQATDPWRDIQISSGFGYRRDPFNRRVRFHSGVDLKARLGDPVAASQDGVVLFAGWYYGYGNLIIIDHGDGITTRYGHLSSFAAEAGQEVKRGDIIAYAGSTGRATSPHLHYEVRVNGEAVNPTEPIFLETEDTVPVLTDEDDGPSR